MSSGEEAPMTRGDWITSCISDQNTFKASTFNLQPSSFLAVNDPQSGLQDSPVDNSTLDLNNRRLSVNHRQIPLTFIAPNPGLHPYWLTHPGQFACRPCIGCDQQPCQG